MQYFTQDDNYEMMHLTDDESVLDTVEKMNLPWKGSGDDVEKTVEDLKCGGKVRVSRHLHVTQNYVPKYKKYNPTAELNYESLIGPFFATYMQEYVERQEGKYDELLATVRKLLKVKITGSTTKKHLVLNDAGKYCLTCIDIHKDKATWRKDDYKMVLRYFEFSVKNLDDELEPSVDEIVTVVNAHSQPSEFPEPGPVPTLPAETYTPPPPPPMEEPVDLTPPPVLSASEPSFTSEPVDPAPLVDMTIDAEEVDLQNE